MHDTLSLLSTLSQNKYVISGSAEQYINLIYINEGELNEVVDQNVFSNSFLSLLWKKITALDNNLDKPRLSQAVINVTLWKQTSAAFWKYLLSFSYLIIHISQNNKRIPVNKWEQGGKAPIGFKRFGVFQKVICN